MKKKTYFALLLGLAMVVSACGQAETADVVAAAGDGQSTVDEAGGGEASDTESETEPAGDSPDDAAGAGRPDEMTSDSTDSASNAEDASNADSDETSTGDADNSDDVASTGDADARLGTLRSVLLERTLDSADEISSARFEGTMTMVGAPDSELPGELSIVFSGAYDLTNNASEVSVDLSGILAAAAASDPEAAAGMELFAGFFQDPMQVITIGDRSWMKWGLISLLTGAGDMWLEGEAGQTDDMTTQFGFGGDGSPTAMLDLLADANASVVEVGIEDVRGVQTTHYRATIDTATLAETMSADEQAELAAELGADFISELPMDFWIDGDGMLHRYILDISEAIVQQGGDEEFTGATFTFEMWDHGADLGITPPPADQVLSEDEINFDFADFGALGG